MVDFPIRIRTGGRFGDFKTGVSEAMPDRHSPPPMPRFEYSHVRIGKEGRPIVFNRSVEAGQYLEIDLDTGYQKTQKFVVGDMAGEFYEFEFGFTRGANPDGTTSVITPTHFVQGKVVNRTLGDWVFMSGGVCYDFATLAGHTVRRTES